MNARTDTNMGLQQGMTLIELMLAITVLAIMAALAGPSFKATIAKNMTNTQARELRVALQEARSEAVSRGMQVGICSSSDGSNCTETDWNEGWIIFEDSVAQDARRAASSESLIKVHEAMSDSTVITPAAALLAFRSTGYRNEAAGGGDIVLKICHDNNEVQYARAVVISLSGIVTASRDTDDDAIHNNGGVNLTCP